MKITSNEIRQKYLDYFKKQDHFVIPSAPIVPENDPSVLFTTAGMHPLVPYLLGEKHPLGVRLVNYQKCIRTGDIDEVGDNSHLTFFEMLGNWSLGEYFKKESIKWSFEFLTSKEYLGIDIKKLAITVFKGDENAPRDEESAIIWQEVGIPKDRISYMEKKDNWWGPAGTTGPCGPDTEIFYWVGESEFPPLGSNVKNDEKNWMEIWNNVFMEYLKDKDGNYNLSSMQNVDTGMGLERITAILNGKKNVYETDIFIDIIEEIENIIGKKYNEETKRGMRIIADHIRASVIMISDGVTPSNTDRGYILRRLIRRSIREGYKLGRKQPFLKGVAIKVISKFENIYSQVKENSSFIINELENEEKQFFSTLEKGVSEFNKLVLNIKKVDLNRNYFTGEEAFNLYQTYGFPVEMIEELAFESNFSNKGTCPVSRDEFDKEFIKHQELSRAGALEKFKGGLADNSEATTALHSATHLLLAGLRIILSEDIHQKGSNITAERLRFDFNYNDKLTIEQLKQVEEYVNNAIKAGFKVEIINMDKQEAKETGVEGSFWEKYPDIVKVYTMKGNDGTIYSRELCGGPHVVDSKNMGTFKIIKEESSSRGVRRIKAALVK